MSSPACVCYTQEMDYVDSSWLIAIAFDLVFFLSGRGLAEAMREGGAAQAGSREAAIYTPRPSLGYAGVLRAVRARRRFMVVLLCVAALSLAPYLARLPAPAGMAPWFLAFLSISRVELLTTLAAPFAGFVSYRPLAPTSDADEGDARAAAQAWPSSGWLRAVARAVRPLAFPLSVAYVLLLYVPPIIWPLNEAEAFAGGQMSGSGGVMAASSPATAGQASLAYAMASLGIEPEGERDIGVAAHATSKGADIWQLARYAASHGCQWRFVEVPRASEPAYEWLGSVGAPAVVPVAGEGEGRAYIALLGTDAGAPGAGGSSDTPRGSSGPGESEAGGSSGTPGGSNGSGAPDARVVVVDPADGRMTLGADAFFERYAVDGPALAMRLRPTGQG